MGRRLTTTVACLAALAALVTSAGSSAPTTFPGPNGKIALSHGLRSDRPGIDLMNPDGSGRTTIPTAAGYSPVWSADGRWLAYSTFPEPWAMRVARADGTGDRELLSARAGDPPTWPTEFAWAPSGLEIAYKCPAGLCAVRVADGGTRRILEYQSSGTAGPSWAPDGTRIAFRCPGAVLCLVSPDGTDLVGFVGSSALVGGRCCDWSPDGTRILLTGGRTKVYTVDVEDGEVRLLGDIGGDAVAAARWSADGTAVLVRSFPSVYVLRLDGSRPVKLTDGDIGDWGTSPATVVSDTRLEPRWVLSRQAGRLQLRGAASHASSLRVTLRSASRTFPPMTVSVSGGGYAVSVPLPRELLPGRLEIVVGGTSGSEPLLTVVRAETLAAPATGLVSRSWVSLTLKGEPTACVRWTRTAPFYANFAFSVRPTTKRLRAVWISPAGVVVSSPQVASARVVSARQIAANLGRGRWRCRLEAGGTPLAIATVRVGC